MKYNGSGLVLVRAAFMARTSSSVGLLYIWIMSSTEGTGRTAVEGGRNWRMEGGQLGFVSSSLVHIRISHIDLHNDRRP